MPLTSAQLATLKTAIAANSTTIPAGQPWTGSFAGQAINALPNNADANTAIAGWYNMTASPDYFGWKPSVTRSDVYHTTSLDGTTWNWTTYKNQSAVEQNAWTQMFMGDSGPIALVNFRQGVASIFTGSAQANAQRDHVFSIGRRLVTNGEKVYATAVVSPPANTGNNTGTARGSATNPDNLPFTGSITRSDVENARNLP